MYRVWLQLNPFSPSTWEQPCKHARSMALVWLTERLTYLTGWEHMKAQCLSISPPKFGWIAWTTPWWHVVTDFHAQMALMQDVHQIQLLKLSSACGHLSLPSQTHPCLMGATPTLSGGICRETKPLDERMFSYVFDCPPCFYQTPHFL